MQMLRLFFALTISEDIKESIAAIQEDITDRLPSKNVKMVAPRNIHLTLHFLGDTDTAKLPVLKTIMHDTAAGIGSFSVSVSGFNAFPGIKRPSVLYLGLKEGKGSIEKVHGKMGSLLRNAGFSTDKRPFTPHLTIGRVKKRPDSRSAEVFEQLRNRYASGIFGEFSVEEAVLYKSTLTPSGAVYEEIEKARLA